MSVGAFLGIGAAALGLVLTPGPNMIYLVSRTITQGRRAGLVSLLGVAVGFLCYLGAATLGLVALILYVPRLYTAIQVAGAVYLLYLAWQALRPGGRSAFASAEVPPDTPWRLFTMGLVTNLTNPKIAVLYVSLLPQFVDPARGNVAGQTLLLGLTQIAIALSVNGLIVLSAGTVAAFLARRPGWLRAQRWVMGAVLAVLAVVVVVDRPRVPAR